MVTVKRSAAAIEPVGLAMGGRSVGDKKWETGLRTALTRGSGAIDLLGVGNPIRGDDAVGLTIASELRRTLGAIPAKGFRIHMPTSAPERLLSKLAGTSEKILIFDAVEASKEPGEIVCASLAESKYGFFATHNIPIRLIPGLEARVDDVYLVGVQPQSLEVGEELSDVVRESAAQVVTAVTEFLEGVS
jgi:hydrogenase maturation protease